MSVEIFHILLSGVCAWKISAFQLVKGVMASSSISANWTLTILDFSDFDLDILLSEHDLFFSSWSHCPYTDVTFWNVANSRFAFIKGYKTWEVFVFYSEKITGCLSLNHQRVITLILAHCLIIINDSLLSGINSEMRVLSEMMSFTYSVCFSHSLIWYGVVQFEK